jgi:hypothetical protein
MFAPGMELHVDELFKNILFNRYPAKAALGSFTTLIEVD